jgi:very-long-chain enoyl-CoA reductase
MELPLTSLHKAGGKPMRKLPDSIVIDGTTTVEDAKKKIAKAAGGVDYNRIGIYDNTKALLKDRKMILMKQDTVINGQEILVKDLGMCPVCVSEQTNSVISLGAQISWKMTFVIEYIGPIIFHLSALFVRPYIYNNALISDVLGLGTVTKATDHLSEAQYIAMAMITLHYVKRELETLFLHKFSAASMPAYMVIRNSWHYWVSGGAQLALWIYAPTGNSAKPINDTFTKVMVYGGVVLYVIGEAVNLYCHVVLSRLRSPGGTERGLPHGFSFDWWATSPNYVWEILAWIGVIMVTRSWNTLYFIVWGWWYMEQWAQGKESVYRKEFGSKYKARKWPLTPGIPFKDPKKSRKSLEKKAA